MVYYATDSRLQLAREHADLLEAEMRRSRRLALDEAGYPRGPRLGPPLARYLERLRRRGSHHTPAFGT